MDPKVAVMAVCSGCGAVVRMVNGDYVINHGPGCPYAVKPTRSIAMGGSKNQDRKHKFSEAWPDYWPKYQEEYQFHPHRRWRFDFAWPDHKIAVEVDGNAWHVKGGGRHNQDKDLEKLNQATLMGWRVFRFSPGMLGRSPYLVNIVKQLLDKESTWQEES